MRATRLLSIDDAPVLAELVQINRDFFAPWEPLRDEDYFTVEGQRAGISDSLERHQHGSCLPHVILDDSGNVIGRITLNNILRGPFQSGTLGIWLSSAHNGRGFATAAVREIVRVAFEEEGLHRIQVATLPHNVRSQGILERLGFVRIGMAPAYFNIEGRWQDHLLFQLVKADSAPAR
jgi:[ribosomal protein S5]-alanine N-acetyltransferase